MKIIAIAGFAGSGKSTFAKYLYDMLIVHGVDVTEVSFGESPKQIFAEIKGTTAEDLFLDPSIKNINRADLVDFAETMKDIFGRDIWAKKLIRKIEAMKHPKKVIIISDIRFFEELNELKKIEECELLLVKMLRPQVEPKTTEQWYKTGKSRNLLTGDQIYQYYNIVDPNDLAFDASEPFMIVENSLDISQLKRLAQGYLKLIDTINNLKEKQNV